MRTTLIVVVAGCLFMVGTVAGCGGAEKPGKFAVTFAWGPDGPPAEAEYGDLWLWGRVERREGEDQSAWMRLAETDLKKYQVTSSLSLPVGDIPDNDHLVVIVELVQAPSKEERPVLYGISSPFSIGPGSDLHLSVSVPLTRAPEITAGTFRILEVAGPSNSHISQSQITLSLSSPGFSRALISNHGDFPVGTDLVRSFNRSEFSSLDIAGGLLVADSSLTVGWDVNHGLNETADGLRSVFLKLLDDNGYESNVQSIKVILDTHPPAEPAVALETPDAWATSAGEDIVAEIILAVIGADEMWIEACEGDCREGDGISDGLGMCSRPDRHCLEAVNEWGPYRTSGWFSIRDESLRNVHVKYRDFAGNETDWVVTSFQSVGRVDISWAAIPGASFVMGCSLNDLACDESELPPHTVAIDSFSIMNTEVTQHQYLSVTGQRPSWFTDCGEYCPVEYVDRYQAAAFCRMVGGRLPSEAEWEYAARGGMATRTYCGDDLSCLIDIAWFIENSGEMTHPVGQKEPNGFGTFDMLGNVWEWVADCWNDNYTGAPDRGTVWSDGLCAYGVLRGGGWNRDASHLRSSERSRNIPGARYGNAGFRCVRD